MIDLIFNERLWQSALFCFLKVYTMAVIKPFKGIRPPKNLVESVASRPYDVLDSEEARVEAGDNEKSLYHIIKPEINFEVGTSEYDPRAYNSAVEQFQLFQDKGWLVQDDKEHYYIRGQLHPQEEYKYQ